jgi:rhodanese-related sulfurtransferase
MSKDYFIKTISFLLIKIVIMYNSNVIERSEKRMKELTVKEVEQLLHTNKKISLIDVREVEEVAAGKIPGVKNIPLSELTEKLDEINKNEEHILICRSGNRSGNAGAYLSDLGYKVINMTGGMLEWEGEVE